MVECLLTLSSFVLETSHLPSAGPSPRRTRLLSCLGWCEAGGICLPCLPRKAPGRCPRCLTAGLCGVPALLIPVREGLRNWCCKLLPYDLELVRWPSIFSSINGNRNTHLIELFWGWLVKSTLQINGKGSSIFIDTNDYDHKVTASSLCLAL